MIKPMLNDYMLATLATQSMVIFWAFFTIGFLGYGLVMYSDLAVKLSVGCCVLCACAWMKQYEPAERIKTKAVVIAARRQSES